MRTRNPDLQYKCDWRNDAVDTRQSLSANCDAAGSEIAHASELPLAVVASGVKCGLRLKRIGRDFLIALSLANVTFLRLWSELLDVGAGARYSMRLPPRPVALQSAIINVFMLGGVLCLAATLARRTVRGRLVLQWGTLLFCAFPLNALRSVLAMSYFPSFGGTPAQAGGRVEVVALIAASCGIMAALTLFRTRVARLAPAVLLIVSPLVFINVGRAVVQIVSYNPQAYADKPLAGPVSVVPPPRRAVWIIFDEMDEGIAFANRRPGLSLPEFDRLRDESFYALHAYSPALNTLESMPALITGKPVATAESVSPDRLSLHFADGSVGEFQKEKNVFSRARQAGFQTAVAGWYHPYCRVLNDSLTECQWSEFDSPTKNNSTGERLPEVALNQVRSLLPPTLFPIGQSLTSLHHVRIYQQVLAAGTRFAIDPRIGLVLIHFPVPHSPYIYNSKTRRLGAENTGAAGYSDALELADQTLSSVRSAMQAAGVWDSTTVLISADHGYRRPRKVNNPQSDRWVPFVLKLAGQHNPQAYGRSVNTIMTSDLLLQVLQGHLRTATQVSAWLVER